MSSKSRALLFWPALLALPIAPAADTSEPPGTLTVAASEPLTLLRDTLAQRVSAGEIACVSLLVIHDGALVWEESMGWADTARTVPASSSTRYPIASVSKSIAGLAATILLDEGAFDLDTPVGDVLTSFPVRTGAWVEGTLRIAHLTGMTASMPHGSLTWLRDAPPIAEASSDAVRAFAVVDGEPGTDRYSNYTSGVLECVVADAAGVPFAGFVAQRIFEPLGMGTSAAVPELEEASAYASLTWGPDDRLDAPPTKAPTAGLGFYSTVSDLARLARAHLGLPGEGASRTRAPSHAVLRRSRRAPDDANGYWLGWGSWGEDPTFELTNGQTFDATSAVLLCERERAAVVCLTNTQWDGEPGQSARLADALALGVMEAIVPGCSASFDLARKVHESKGAARDSVERSAPPMDVAGAWSGAIDLAGRVYDAGLEFDADGGAVLRFGPITASAASARVGKSTVSASFECEGELEAAGETSGVTYLSMSVRRLDDGRLAGSTVFGLYDDARTIVGTAPALAWFARVP